MGLCELLLGYGRHLDAVAALDQLTLGERLSCQPLERGADRRQLRPQPAPALVIQISILDEREKLVRPFVDRQGRRQRFGLHGIGEIRRAYVALDQLRREAPQPEHQLEIPFTHIHDLR